MILPALFPFLHFAVDADNRFGDYVIYALETDQTLLSASGGTRVDLDTEIYRDAESYELSASGIIVKEQGLYLAINHMAFDRGATGTNRTSGETFLHINGSLVAGAYTDGFLKRSTGLDEADDCAFGMYELEVDDYVEMFANRININGSDGRLIGSTHTNTDGITSLSLIKLNDNQDYIILEATQAESDITLFNQDERTDVPWDVQIHNDTDSFTHSTSSNPAEITISDIGKYLILYSDTYDRAFDNKTRTGVYNHLNLDDNRIAGSWAHNYVRGSMSGESILKGNNSCATLFETTASNQVVKLVVAPEDQEAFRRLCPSARMAIYRLPSGTTSFKTTNSTTEAIDNGTAFTMAYDTSVWVDSEYTLSSNEITVNSDGKYLFFQQSLGDDGSTQRANPTQTFVITGTLNNYFVGSKQARNSNNMEMASPTIGAVATLENTDTISVQNQSRAGTGTSLDHLPHTGSFCGLDISTLG